MVYMLTASQKRVYLHHLIIVVLSHVGCLLLCHTNSITSRLCGEGIAMQSLLCWSCISGLRKRSIGGASDRREHSQWEGKVAGREGYRSLAFAFPLEASKPALHQTPLNCNRYRTAAAMPTVKWRSWRTLARRRGKSGRRQKTRRRQQQRAARQRLRVCVLCVGKSLAQGR